MSLIKELDPSSTSLERATLKSLPKHLENELLYLLDDLENTQVVVPTYYNHHHNRLESLWTQLENSDPMRFKYERDLDSYKKASPEERTQWIDVVEDPIHKVILQCVSLLHKQEEQLGQKKSSPSNFWVGLEKKVTANHPGLGIVKLQESVDAMQGEKISEAEKKIKEIEQGLGLLNSHVADLNKKIELDKDENVNLVDLEPQIKKLHAYWKQTTEMRPDLLADHDCPFPEDLDLKSVDTKTLLNIQEKCRNLNSRLLERSKLVTLALQTAINLYELLVKITTAMADEVKKQGHHIQNNISKTPA